MTPAAHVDFARLNTAPVADQKKMAYAWDIAMSGLERRILLRLSKLPLDWQALPWREFDADSRAVILWSAVHLKKWGGLLESSVTTTKEQAP